MKTPACLSIAALMLAPAAFGAPLCSSLTIANYQDLINLGSTGCQIGPLNFSSFGFSSSAGGGSPVISASAIGVTLETNFPTTGAFGFAFTPPMLDASNGFQDVGLTFTVTAVTGVGTDMHLQFNGSFTGTGSTSVNEQYCAGSTTVNCSSPPQLHVINNVSASKLTDDVVFGTGVTSVGVAEDINAMAGSDGTAVISQVINTFSTLSPQISKALDPTTIALNGTTTLTLAITNPSTSITETGVAFTDTLPAGLVVATPNGLTSTCGGTATATAGSGSVSLSGGTLAASASCTVSLNVAGTTAGMKNNSVQVTSTEGGTGSTATANVTVVAPPMMSKSFGSDTVHLSETTSLTFVVTNPNLTAGLTNIGFTDTLPAGLLVATPNGLASTCGGTTTATSGSGTITLSGASIAANGSCTVAVNVIGTGVGSLLNTTSTVTSTEGGPGAPASARIIVLAPIPALGGWGLLILTALLGVLALMVLRRSSM